MALTQSVTNSSQRVIMKLTKFWKEISNQYNACRVKSFENENKNPGYARDAIWLIPETDLCGRVPLWNWRTQVRLADSTRPGPSLDDFIVHLWMQWGWNITHFRVGVKARHKMSEHTRNCPAQFYIKTEKNQRVRILGALLADAGFFRKPYFEDELQNISSFSSL